VDANACGHHPDRPADGGTCNRCGTFICAECAVEGARATLCAPCLKRLDQAGYVRHVRVLGILMLIHGGLLVATGLYYVIFGGFMLDAFADIPADPNDPASEMLPGMMVGIVSLMGAAQFLPGGLQIIGGWRLFQLHGAGWAWGGALAGVVSLLGCYCAPTAFALLGYAVFVLSRDEVRARIAVGAPPASSSA